MKTESSLAGTVGIAIGLFLLSFLFCAVFSDGFHRVSDLTGGLRLVFGFMGSIIAAVSLIELFRAARRSASPNEMLAWITVILASTVMAVPHWATALALAAIGIAVLFTARRHNRQEPANE